MTSEEKAREIIGVGCNRQRCRECGGSLSVAEGCVEFIHIKEMAEWKEKQMIDKACKWITGCFEFLNDAGNHNFKIDRFIEDFKKAMEE